MHLGILHLTQLVSVPADVSSDDTSTAFIWRAATHVRLPRLDPSIRSTIASAVDTNTNKRVLHLFPPFNARGTTWEQFVTARSAVDPKTSRLEFSARAIAMYLNRTPNKATFSVTAKCHTSFLGEAEENGLEFKLGLGTPQAVRRLQFQTLEGLAFLMRRTLQDGIEAAICLRDEDMGSMRVDAEFAKYAMYIG
ncbi:hypothetical protein N7508_002045 [Penicillium antarcticum]|uniref:uncharacterized protein n=1 Tax=Penicillium antarcticum TaxID=416450 RepID=UPI00239F3630|nr:uncharacterized protein N7508_002045 [Penicillium antarcticum]KAJ5317537.1 hypothetical protein N7508_002045 [Penicillium antarcticum]